MARPASYVTTKEFNTFQKQVLKDIKSLSKQLTKAKIGLVNFKSKRAKKKAA